MENINGSCRFSQPSESNTNTASMKVRTVFDQLQEIPLRFTCLGGNISVPYELKDISEGTKTFVLILEDLDALPKPWIHWLVFNVPASTTGTSEGVIPAGGVEGLANNHTFGYEGPCPKYFQGKHHYRLIVFALDTLLELPAASGKHEVMEAMEDHVIDKAEIIGICTST